VIIEVIGRYESRNENVFTSSFCLYLFQLKGKFPCPLLAPSTSNYIWRRDPRFVLTNSLLHIILYCYCLLLQFMITRSFIYPFIATNESHPVSFEKH